MDPLELAGAAAQRARQLWRRCAATINLRARAGQLVDQVLELLEQLGRRARGRCHDE